MGREVVLTNEAIIEKIIELRGEKVILDSDVAELYGVETKRINEAVKNNPDRFPSGYIIETTSDELDYLRSKFSTAKLSKTRVLPKVFTERGLYMLATILTSKQAIATTIAIVEAFQKIKNLSRVIKRLPSPDKTRTTIAHAKKRRDNCRYSR